MKREPVLALGLAVPDFCGTSPGAVGVVSNTLVIAFYLLSSLQSRVSDLSGCSSLASPFK